MLNVADGPTCRVCESKTVFHWLGDHLAEEHGLTVDQYLDRFPDAPTIDTTLYDLHLEQVAKKEAVRAAPSPDLTLTVPFGGFSFPVHLDVPAKDCLPLPDHYKVPTSGALAADIADLSVALRRNRSLWIWGPPGTGKDAAVSAFAAMTRTPSLLFTIVQGADITSWKFSRAFNAKGTSWEEGSLLRALRDGYVTRTGRRLPYLIVLSDFDRATRQQAEELRQVLDSIQGRVTGPTGEVWPTVPGTRIVATANSSGGGDTTGRYTSVNPIDATILDRFERKLRFHPLEAEDEKEILRSKFPVLASTHPKAIEEIMNATTAVRGAVKAEEVFVEWSHRAVCAWAGAAEDYMEEISSLRAHHGTLLKRAVRVILDGCPDEETRESVKALIDPHITGGTIDPGDTSHFNPSPLQR
jgi:MoxR-like ATPase